MYNGASDLIVNWKINLLGKFADFNIFVWGFPQLLLQPNFWHISRPMHVNVRTMHGGNAGMGGPILGVSKTVGVRRRVIEGCLNIYIHIYSSLCYRINIYA